MAGPNLVHPEKKKKKIKRRWVCWAACIFTLAESSWTHFHPAQMGESGPTQFNNNKKKNKNIPMFISK